MRKRTCFYLCMAALALIVCGQQQNTMASVGLFPVIQGGKWSYIDRSGRVMFNQRFDMAYRFAEGWARVKVGDKWGFIDTSGKIVNMEVDAAQLGGKPTKGVIPDRVVVNLQFDAAGDFSQGMAAVKIGDKWGYINPRVASRKNLTFGASGSSLSAR